MHLGGEHRSSPSGLSRPVKLRGQSITLRRKTLISTALTLVSLMAVLYFLSTNIFMRGFDGVEEDSVVHNVGRATDALGEDVSTLEDLTRDWASWDDTYTFIEDRNPEYIASNLELDNSYANNEVNLMVYLNQSGETVFAKGYDLVNEEEAPVPESIGQHMTPESPLLISTDTADGNSGILMLPEGPMLIAAQPILTSEQTGPARPGGRSSGAVGWMKPRSPGWRELYICR